MSFQTGRPVVPPPTEQDRGLGWLRAYLEHHLSNPNPVLVREMKQAARLTRTPFFLLAATLLPMLLISAIGGAMSSSTNPAAIGVAVFHTFFSIAFFVVTIAGPAVAASSFASEREGKTWEALQLTGLPPAVVARGKFLSSFVNIALYIVMMAPVGAMAFLFGGVTATETVMAFVWLFILAGLSVAFGLAISSKLESLRGVFLMAVFLAVLVSPNLFLAAGVGGSVLAHEIWPLIQKGPPVWLPVAYARAPFDLNYLAVLVAAPAVLVTLPGWFLYEATIASLTSVTDDRSTGMRRWFLVSSVVLALGASLVVAGVNASDRGPASLAMFCCYFLFLAACIFIFQGEPIGPSRRVTLRWQRENASALRRAMGPGVMRATHTLLAAATVGVGILSLTTLGAMAASKASGSDALALGMVAVYGLCFVLFLAGLGAWLRVRTNGVGVSRVVLGVVLFLAAVGPWVVAAMAGSFGGGSTNDMLIAAPSPFFPVVAVDEIRRASSPGPFAAASLVSSAAWALLGSGLLVAASLRCSRVIRAHEKALAEGDAFLQAEDEAAAAQAAPPVDDEQATS